MKLVEDAAETIGYREYNARRGCDPRSELELAQLVRDVADVMATLTDEQRVFAEDLASRSKADIARDMGIPRTTLSSRVRPALRRFEDAGLKDYLDSALFTKPEHHDQVFLSPNNIRYHFEAASLVESNCSRVVAMDHQRKPLRLLVCVPGPLVSYLLRRSNQMRHELA